jgi:hypothetical protein
VRGKLSVGVKTLCSLKLWGVHLRDQIRPPRDKFTPRGKLMLVKTGTDDMIFIIFFPKILAGNWRFFLNYC